MNCSKCIFSNPTTSHVGEALAQYFFPYDSYLLRIHFVTSILTRAKYMNTPTPVSTPFINSSSSTPTDQLTFNEFTLENGTVVVEIVGYRVGTFEYSINCYEQSSIKRTQVYFITILSCMYFPYFVLSLAHLTLCQYVQLAMLDKSAQMSLVYVKVSDFKITPYYYYFLQCRITFVQIVLLAFGVAEMNHAQILTNVGQPICV